MFGVYGIHTESAAKWTIVTRTHSAIFEWFFNYHVHAVRSKHFLGIHKFNIRGLGEWREFPFIHNPNISSWQSF